MAFICVYYYTFGTTNSTSLDQDKLAHYLFSACFVSWERDHVLYFFVKRPTKTPSWFPSERKRKHTIKLGCQYIKLFWKERVGYHNNMIVCCCAACDHGTLILLMWMSTHGRVSQSCKTYLRRKNYIWILFSSQNKYNGGTGRQT